MVTVLRAGGVVDSGNRNADERFMLIVDDIGDILRGNKNSLKWLGQSPQDLAQANLSDLLAIQSKPLLTDIIVNTVSGFHMRKQPVMVHCENRLVKGFQISGSPVDEAAIQNGEASEYRLDFEYDPSLTKSANPLNTQKGFAKSAAEIAQNTTKDLDLTLVSVGDEAASGTEPHLAQAAFQNMSNSIHEKLAETALGGAAVGDLGGGKFGLLHDAEAALDDLEINLNKIVSELASDGHNLSIQTKTISLSDSDLSQDELTHAVSHILEDYIQNDIESLIYGDLAEAHSAYKTLHQEKLSILQNAITQKELTLAYRPIVNVHKWTSNHVMATARVNRELGSLGGYEIEKLCKEHPELRADLDLAQVQLLEDSLTAIPCQLEIQIHVRSLLEPEILTSLMEFAQVNSNKSVLLRILGFRPEDRERLIALKSLHTAGFAVALYGTEIGIINSEILKSLPIDYIILDDGFTESIGQFRAALDMLKVMEKRCLPYGIKLIFDNILQESMAEEIAQLQASLASGSYFGDASDSIESLRYPIET